MALNLLDYFAGQALAGMQASPRFRGKHWIPLDDAGDAYDLAEAMIAERERRAKGGDA